MLTDCRQGDQGTGAAIAVPCTLAPGSGLPGILDQGGREGAGGCQHSGLGLVAEAHTCIVSAIGTDLMGEEINMNWTVYIALHVDGHIAISKYSNFCLYINLS